jgi:hypothetical protein
MNNQPIESLRAESRAAEKSAIEQIDQVEQFLDGLGRIAEGDNLVERVINAVTHYATQMGRWVEQNK